MHIYTNQSWSWRYSFWNRVLVKSARKLAQQYILNYQEQIPTGQLVQKIATVMQEYTQQGLESYYILLLCSECQIFKHLERNLFFVFFRLMTK